MKKQPLRLGLGWILEAAISFVVETPGSPPQHRPAQPPPTRRALCLAATVLIVGGLIDWRNRWSPAASANLRRGREIFVEGQLAA